MNESNKSKFILLYTFNFSEILFYIIELIYKYQNMQSEIRRTSLSQQEN
jgi:hypothetical protein